jgi:hypothetical protein
MDMENDTIGNNLNNNPNIKMAQETLIQNM